MQKGFVRKEIIPISEVENAVKDVMFCKNKRDSYINIRGDIIKGNSQRFQTFFTKGLKCSCCVIDGKYFAKEKDPNAARYHLNLYAIDDDGEEVLIIKKHIIPLYKGGKNDIINFQTICENCNKNKRNITVKN